MYITLFLDQIYAIIALFLSPTPMLTSDICSNFLRACKEVYVAPGLVIIKASFSFKCPLSIIIHATLIIPEYNWHGWLCRALQT